MVLTEALTARGVDVINVPLEDLARIIRPRDVDLVHVHHLSKAAVVAGLMDRSVRFVFTRHGAEQVSGWRRRAGLRLVMRRMDAGVCLSQRELDDACALYPGTRSKLRVIRNGMAFPASEPALKPDEGEIHGLFVGQLIGLKRVAMILDAMVAEPRMSLRLVYHNSSLERQLKQKCKELGLNARVEFVGQLSGEALYREYRRAHVLLLPSWSEALPSVVTEALAFGVPVVASNVGGISEQVRGAGVLFDRDDPYGLQMALREYATNRHSLNGQAKLRSLEVRDEFSVETMAKEHLALYERLMET
ncbi:glycosyltransferase family 4 protein [Nocardioides sp. SYSU DS0663]|uniref:glycosyltransferase family 4 protein n=1 Tax=Nocardioides sp. SYSU DS0663 TaxID=3416445 RepID=UPI003F4B5F14